MKFKKAFAWILAVAMVITLMPSMAFATSTNTVKAVPTVASNSGMPETSISVEVKDNNWNNGATMKAQNIRLNFTNAKWDTKPVTTTGTTSDSAIRLSAADGGTAVLEASIDDGTPSGTRAADVRFTKVNVVEDNAVEFEFVAVDGSGNIVSVEKNDVFTFTFPQDKLKSESEDGPVTIAIDGLDSYVSSSTLTVATVGSNNTVATVNGSPKTYGRVSGGNGVTMDTTIELRETAVNSITDDQVIKFMLPKGMEWKGLTVGGNLFTNASIGSVTFSGSSSPANMTGPDSLKTGGPGNYYIGNDGRALYMYFEVDDKSDVRQVATFKPQILIKKDASEGDITVDITSYHAVGNSSAISETSDLVVGHYGSESVTISTTEEANLPVIYSGYLQTNKDKDTYVQLTIKEAVKDSLTSDRPIDIEFPEAVQVLKDVGIKTTLEKNPDIDDAKTYGTIDAPYVDYGDSTATKDNSDFTLTVPNNGNNITTASKSNKTWSADKANEWTVFIPVTIRADFTGDIEATIKGARAGVDETTIVVGKAESPITVTANTTEVRNGVQSQALADITITENVAGYLDDKSGENVVTLDIDTLNLDGTSLTAAKAEVTDGDLEIKNVKRNQNKLTFEIDAESTKPSTISITGVVGALNRTLPEGPYALRVYGSALVKNGPYNDNDFQTPDYQNGNGDVCAAKVADYIKIVTPADPSTITNKINAVFTLRQDTFTNNGETVQMDTAPYLDANNRTQLPIRYAAIACGVPESDISWNQATQTATINAGSKVLRITIGSNIMQTSDGIVTMDTAAVSSNGRIFVPIRYIANALGATVAWDQDAKTITLTN